MFSLVTNLKIYQFNKKEECLMRKRKVNSFKNLTKKIIIGINKKIDRILSERKKERKE